MADSRVQDRLNGRGKPAEVVDALKHLEPLVRFNGDGKPAEGDLAAAISRQRIAIEIPRDMDQLERNAEQVRVRHRVRTTSLNRRGHHRREATGTPVMITPGEDSYGFMS